MVIEFTGPPGAGKTSLLLETARALRERGWDARSAPEMTLARLEDALLGRVIPRRMPPHVRRLVLKVFAKASTYVLGVVYLLAKPRLAREAFLTPIRRRAPWLERRLVWERFIANAGHYALFERMRGPRDVLLFSEGFTHRACGLFRHRDARDAIDRNGIARFLALTPACDLTVRVSAPLDVCLERIGRRAKRSPLLRGRSASQIAEVVASAAIISEEACRTLAGSGRSVLNVDNSGDLDASLAQLTSTLEILSRTPASVTVTPMPKPGAGDRESVPAPSTRRWTYLQVLPRLIVGGAEQVVSDLALAMDPSRCDAIVLCISGEGPLQDRLRSSGREVIVWRHGGVPLRRFPRWLLNHVRLIRDVARLVRERRVDVVQTHVLGARHALVGLAARWGGATVVAWTFHNVHFLREGWFGLRPVVWAMLFRLASPAVDSIVAVSRGVRDGLIARARIPASKITVILNGIDVERYAAPMDAMAVRGRLGFGPDERLITTVATLKRQKGHTILLEAAPAVLARHPEARFLIVGDGQLRDELEAQARNLGIAGQVHFAGTRPDVPELLMASDVFVMPSLWDGLSIALLEAMAAGKPIVATDVSGVWEIMQDGVTGRVVPPGDAPAIAKAVLTMLDNPREAEQMGSAARLLARRDYGRERFAQAHLELFDRLLASKRHHRRPRAGTSGGKFMPWRAGARQDRIS